jgi:hypothetical protein
MMFVHHPEGGGNVLFKVKVLDCTLFWKALLLNVHLAAKHHNVIYFEIMVMY